MNSDFLIIYLLVGPDNGILHPIWVPPFHSFIHSLQTFVQRLFKWGYSEALPTPARPNNVVLSCWRNFWENTLGSDRQASGRPFHTKGPTTEKARFCMMEVRANIWDMKEALLSRAKVTGAPSAKGRATKVSKVGRGLTCQGVPNEDCYPELNALSQREPVDDIPHIGRNVVKFRYPTKLGGQQSAERGPGSSGEWQGDQYKENYSSQAWR